MTKAEKIKCAVQFVLATAWLILGIAIHLDRALTLEDARFIATLACGVLCVYALLDALEGINIGRIDKNDGLRV